MGNAKCKTGGGQREGPFFSCGWLSSSSRPVTVTTITTITTTTTMAGTKYAYVRNFELPDAALPEVYLVVRIDGKGFHKFSAAHHFAKLNDPAALELMNAAARHVMTQLKGHATLAFGESDEYSFLLKRNTALYNRRISKITTHITSLFTAAYVFHWPAFFPNTPLLHPPSFDGRLVQYPNQHVVRDYFAWRQADTHINNLYNTSFWALVHGGQSEQQATQTLSGTVSAQKHDILFQQFNINYDRLEAMYRKGTTLVWTRSPSPSTISAPPITSCNDKDKDKDNDKDTNLDTNTLARIQRKREAKAAKRQQSAISMQLRTLHCDIISDPFWQQQPATLIEQHENQPEQSLEPTTKPWLHPSRLDTAGLGAYAFSD